jgi:hypothetical protein
MASTSINNIFSDYMTKSTQLESTIQSNKRASYLNENYRKRQAEYNILLFYTLLGFLFFLILVAIKRFFPVIPSRIMDFLIFVLFLFIFLFIGYKIYDIQRRYILNFDELNIPSNIKLSEDKDTKGTKNQIEQGKLTDLLSLGSSSLVGSVPYGYTKDANNNVIFDDTNFTYSSGYIIPSTDIIVQTSSPSSASTTTKSCYVTNDTPPTTFKSTLAGPAGGTFSPYFIYYHTTDKEFKSTDSSTEYKLIVKKKGVFNINDFKTKYDVTSSPGVTSSSFFTAGNLILLKKCNSISSSVPGEETKVNGNSFYLIKKNALSGINAVIGTVEGPLFVLNSTF